MVAWKLSKAAIVWRLESKHFNKNQPRWLAQNPRTRALFVYNRHSVMQLKERSPKQTGQLLLSVKEDKLSCLLQKLQPVKLHFVASNEDQQSLLAAVCYDGHCRVVDTESRQILASTLGKQHRCFGAAVHGRFLYLVDFEQEIVLRYNWPLLRGVSVISAVIKSESTLCTIFDCTQPWDLTLIEGHPLVSISSSNCSFSNSSAAVCCNLEQKVWHSALEKPFADHNRRQAESLNGDDDNDAAVGIKAALVLGDDGNTNCNQEAEGGNNNADKSSVAKNTSKQLYHKSPCWLPGDRYVDYDSKTDTVFLSSHWEQAVYAYSVERKENEKHQIELSFKCRSVVSLTEAFSNEADGMFPGDLIFDNEIMRLYVMVGSDCSGVMDRIVSFKFS